MPSKYLIHRYSRRLHVLGEGTHELVLLLDRLEAAVTVLGRGVDELEVDGLEVAAASGGEDALTKSDGSLARSSNATLKHDPVLVDNTVVGEATNGSDGLLGEISLSGSILGITLLADTQDTLVDLGTVEVTVLTSTSAGEADASRVPCSDTGNLAETTVSLAGKTGDTPTSNHTLVTVTTGSRADIHNFTLRKELVDFNLLFKEIAGEVNLLSNRAAIDLNLEEVSLLLAKEDLADLGVGNDTNDLAVLLDAVELNLNLLGLLGVLLGILGESLLLGAVPVLVEASLDLIGQVTSPDGGESAKTIGGLDISHNTNDSHGGRLENGDSLHSLLLMQLRSRSLDLTNDVGHTSLVANEGSEVARCLGISILRERSNATTVVLGSLLGKILERTVTGSFKFAVRHDYWR